MIPKGAYVNMKESAPRTVIVPASLSSWRKHEDYNIEEAFNFPEKKSENINNCIGIKKIQIGK